MALTAEKMVEFFETDLSIEVQDITPETLLFSSGIIDSFALVSIMTFVETEGGIRISPSDVNLSNFDSIARILDYVSREQA